MIYDPKHECMPREELRKLQSERLIQTVRRIYDHVPMYREKMQEAGLTPEDIHSIDDLHKLPFTNKQDLRDHYPYGLFAAPMSDIVRLQASSGTTGKLTVVGYTAKDIDTWSEVMARTMAAGGATRDSIVHVAYGYGLFTGGMGAHYGAERLGATVVPVSAGNTQRQLMLLQDFGADVLACTPSYALHLAESMEDAGMDRSKFKLKYGVFGAEPCSEAMRKEIERRWQIRVTDIYGMCELTGPGVASECEHQTGMHVFEDHFFPEIIDPETLEPLPDGEQGELVFTTLSKEGIPLIRYRTRDITTILDDPCPCGRTLRRIKKILGRSDDMVIIRGVNVFPSQIETLLLEMGDVEPHYLLVVNREGALDTLEVRVEISEVMLTDEVRHLEEIEQKIKAQIASRLGVSAKVKLVEPKTIPRSEGKAKRVQDNRTL